MLSDKKTTISLTHETKKKLARFEAKKGESYEDILQRLLDRSSSLCHNEDVEDQASPH